MTTIFLTVYGKEGMRELAEQNLAKADYSAKDDRWRIKARCCLTGRRASMSLCCEAGAERRGRNEPRLLEKKIIGGLPLAKWYPELGEGATLWCATEVTTKRGWMRRGCSDAADSGAVERGLSDGFSMVGQELSAVEFVQDYLQLRFDGPVLTLFEWPDVFLR